MQHNRCQSMSNSRVASPKIHKEVSKGKKIFCFGQKQNVSLTPRATPLPTFILAHLIKYVCHSLKYDDRPLLIPSLSYGYVLNFNWVFSDFSLDSFSLPFSVKEYSPLDMLIKFPD